MLNKILLVGLLVMHASAGLAQIGEHRSELAIGGGGGYALCKMGFMPEVPQQLHGGLIGGLTARYTSEKYFSSICAIVAELNYAQLGWKEDILTPKDEPVINATTGLAEQYERTISYVQVPVLARLGWGRERRGLQAFIQAGPQVGFYLGESTKSNFDFASRNQAQRTSVVVSQDTMAVERKVDYGITAGAGIEYSHPRMGHLLLEGRYYYGLGDVYGNTKRDYFGRSNFGVIVLKLTYLFDIARTNNPKIR